MRTLVVLILLAIACGLAVGVTIDLTPLYFDESGYGY